MEILRSLRNELISYSNYTIQIIPDEVVFVENVNF